MMFVLVREPIVLSGRFGSRDESYRKTTSTETKTKRGQTLNRRRKPKLTHDNVGSFRRQIASKEPPRVMSRLALGGPQREKRRFISFWGRFQDRPPYLEKLDNDQNRIHS